MSRSDKKIQRRFEILRELVESYVDIPSPVSSDHICGNLKQQVSPATVRSALAETDDLGWTSRTHASGGRIPLAKGYRAYVDTLKKSDLSSSDFRSMAGKALTDFDLSSLDIGPGLQKVASFLSEASGCSGIVLAPQFENDFIRQIRLLPVDGSRLLIVVVSDFGLIKTDTVQIQRKLSYFSQRRIEDYLNARLHSSSSEIEPSVNLADDDEKVFAEGIYNEIVLKYLINLRPKGSGEVFLEGLGRVFDNPELQVREAVQSVIEFFEDKENLVGQMRAAMKRKKATVLIGDEISGVDGAVEFSMIVAPYALNSLNVGVVGIVGPARMAYRKLIPLVEKTAEFISEKLARNFRKPRIAFDRDVPFKVVT